MSGSWLLALASVMAARTVNHRHRVSCLSQSGRLMPGGLPGSALDPRKASWCAASRGWNSSRFRGLGLGRLGGCLLGRTTAARCPGNAGRPPAVCRASAVMYCFKLIEPSPVSGAGSRSVCHGAPRPLPRLLGRSRSTERACPCVCFRVNQRQD